MSKLPGFTADQSIFKSTSVQSLLNRSTESSVQLQWCPSWIPGCTCESRCSLAAAACIAATTGAGAAACAVAEATCIAYCKS